MNRRRKVIRNIIILVIFVFIVLPRMGLYLKPLSAHKFSERSIHYGPSQVIHEQDFEDRKFYLCKYDKWVSCNTVKRSLLLFWHYGNQPTGFENNKSKALDFSWNQSDGGGVFYGIINDHKIKKVEVALEGGKRLTQDKFYKDLFLIPFVLKDGNYFNMKRVRGYDSNKRIVFEEKF